ncbi:hypothetical protein SK128_026705, partial [Halocaridina rubra]
VNYVADHYNGFQADVSYYGEAQFPHTYGPAVTFKPSAYPPPQPAYPPPRPAYPPPSPYH